MRHHLSLTLIVALFAGSVSDATTADLPNIMFISVDDMSCDSVGAFGCPLAGTTPNIDQLATEGMRFEYAHVQVGNCMPCRNVLFSGRYPHNNRVEGFYQVRTPDYPVLCELMQAGGYFTAIRGKVSHSTPYLPFAWDLILDNINGEKQHPKNASSYYRSAALGIKAAANAEQPFCMLVNVSDPHKPFYAMGKSQTVTDDPNVPSRTFSPGEVPIPGFLFDHPDIRLELAHYYSSVRRADDCVGAALKALQDSGQADDTVIVFMSDHGMPLPFAKTALYHHSTRTPWIVKWPGQVQKNHHDTQHMISGVDLLPTLLDIAKIEHPAGLDGRSALPILLGETQLNRDMIFKEYNENSGGHRNPMRGIQTKQFGYLFNPWSDGKRTFKTATTGTLSYRAMQSRAAGNAAIKERLRIFEFAEPEQFFDYTNDPDALHNLIDDPEYQAEIARHRTDLEDWMKRTNDHALAAFQNRDSPEALSRYMKTVESESATRRAKRGSRGRRNSSQKLISLQVPKTVSGPRVIVKISHKLPPNLKTQKLHVTVKNLSGQRLDREVVEISGKGEATVELKWKKGTGKPKVTFAAFVGEDFEHNLQHITAGPVSAADGSCIGAATGLQRCPNATTNRAPQSVNWRKVCLIQRLGMTG